MKIILIFILNVPLVIAPLYLIPNEIVRTTVLIELISKFPVDKIQYLILF